MKMFPVLWSQTRHEGITCVIADKGYDFYAVRTLLRGQEKEPVIPRCKNAAVPGLYTEKQKELYKTRSAIERFFGKMKENKRLALRFEKLDVTLLSFFAVACMKIFNLFC